jgi:hypothetical protein
MAVAVAFRTINPQDNPEQLKENPDNLNGSFSSGFDGL